MTRRSFTSAGLATAVQVASLLVIAAGLLGILMSDIKRNKSASTQIELLARE